MRTLVDLLPEIKRLGNREAIRSSNGLRTWVATYADLYGKIGSVVRFFDEREIHKSHRIVICAENRLEWVAVFWACMARGIEAVPVDVRFSAELIDRIRSESKAKLIVDDAMLDAIARRPSEPFFTTADVSPDDVVEIVYTSGTTGEPKGVVHHHRNICSNLRPLKQEIAKYKKLARIFQPIRILDLLPLSHMFGQSLGLFIPLFLEGSAVFTTELRPAKIIQFARDNRVSVLVSVPRILENLKHNVERNFGTEEKAAHRNFMRLELITRIWRHRRIHRQFGWKFWAFVVGGARVDPAVEEFWKRRGFAVIQGYGLTEASPVVAVNHPFNSRTGSLGKVIEGQDVMIAPDGEILVRGESVTTTDGDWLHTGDLGEIDDEGRLYFRGRKKDVIITPEGLNVHPEDVEAVLNRFPEIRESAVVGTDHVHAVLILNQPSADVTELVRRANSQLESHQRIREWSIWQDDEFPRTPSTLKIRRHEIALRLQVKTNEQASPLPDLSAMSSLERVELLSELENKHQVELDEDSFAQLRSTRELEDWLQSQEHAAGPAGLEKPLSDWARSTPVQLLRSIIQHGLAMPLYRHYLDLIVNGLEHLNGLEAPVIFAVNHTSHLDVPTIYAALPHRWHQRLAPAMMKDHFRAYFEPHGRSWKEILLAATSYFLACSIYNAYPLPQQMSGTRRALAYTGQLVSRCYCPIVFPEGQRTPDGMLHTFRPGIGMMAIRLRIPVIPIRLAGLYEIYSVHDSWPHRGRVRVSVGEPLLFDANISYEQAARRVEEAVRGLPP
jgi:long-chain acyl-CoA synthetase